MTTRFGYLLPTRENIMSEQPAASRLLDSAKQAVDLGFDSLWVGDSLLARPRHDPLTLLAAVAASVPDVEVGTAVLLPHLRNPVVLAQQLATLDQVAEGRLIIGAGIAADNPLVRQEFASAGVPFEKRVGTFMEGYRLMRALWSGEPVNIAGRWPIEDRTLAPVPYRKGGPPFWLASSVPVGITRAANHFEGWFPIGPDVTTFAEQRSHFLDAATSAGKAADDMTSAIYLTVSIDADAAAANHAIDEYLAGYYHPAPAQLMRQFQDCFGGTLEDVLGFIRAYVEAGADHVVLRLVGDHSKQLAALMQHRDEITNKK